MARYIRTKDGVYEVSHLNAYATHKRKGETLLEGYKTAYIKNENIIAQSENLEELCDEFVFVNKVGNFDKSYVIHYDMPNHIFTEPTIKEKIAYIKKYYYDNLNLIKGAIYTDKGLIYVAKMDDKGDLRLL